VRRARLGAVAAIAIAALAATGCGSDSRPTLTVSAAASLQSAFTDYANHLGAADVRQSFAASDQLATQIRQGARPDVFASADTALPDQLHHSGLTDRPRTFAGNRLVIAVPAGSDEVRSLADLERPGTSIVIGEPAVPVGAYTREVLGRLPPAKRRAVLANVRSQEPDTTSVLAKVTEGAADAAFVYATDVEAAGAGVRAIRLPASLQPTVAYGVAVVKGSDHPALAQRFVAGLIHGAGERALRRAGFLPPP
jgi:molybdate transport system substrate-binding protein